MFNVIGNSQEQYENPVLKKVIEGRSERQKYRNDDYIHTRITELENDLLVAIEALYNEIKTLKGDK